MARRTLFFSMVFALSACSGGSDDSSAVAVVATSDDAVVVVPDAVVVDLAITTLNKIQSYATQDTAAPTVADYTAAGITGVNVANLSATNALIKASNAAAVDTLAKIQAIATRAYQFSIALPTLGAIAVGSKIRLNWDTIPNSESYTLCYAIQSLGTPANTDNCSSHTNGNLVQNLGTGTKGTSHTVTGLVNGTTYYFALFAIDSGANQSLPSSQVSATPMGFNDTGITFRGNHPSGNNTDCTGEAIVAQQDCSHGRDADTTLNGDGDGDAGFNFTKLNSAGTALAANAGVWRCVQDNVTGFIWEVKTNDGGLHDAGDLYSWYNSNSNTNGGTVSDANDDGDICEGYVSGQPATYCNTQAFAARVNKAELCGAEDWRLPTIKELSGIVDYGTTSPTIDEDYFHTVSANYWLSSPYAFDSDYAWAINFRYGNDSYNYRYNHYSVRLVSGGQ